MLETSIWIDLLRAKTDPIVRAQIKPWFGRDDIALCEPVLYELLRNAARAQRPFLQRHLETIPVLPTPATLWRDAAQSGQTCLEAGVIMGALDLLIATICIHHDAELVTFDKQFAAMAKVSKLRAKILIRAA